MLPLMKAVGRGEIGKRHSDHISVAQAGIGQHGRKLGREEDIDRSGG